MALKPANNIPKSKTVKRRLRRQKLASWKRDLQKLRAPMAGQVSLAKEARDNSTPTSEKPRISILEFMARQEARDDRT